MSFFRSIRNFFRAFKRAGGQKRPGAGSKSGGLDMEVEKNRPC